jgi:prepilin-type N-terminal cleavage/methylation domain-containing protein
MKLGNDNPLDCSHGFTLLELMVTLGTLAILASVAVPAYQEYTVQARKLECQISIMNYLRAQEIYYLENGLFYADKFNKNGKSTSKIGWNKNKRPDKASKYSFPKLGIEFRRDNFRGYRIRVWQILDPGAYRQEVRLELTTDEDFDGDVEPDYYSYRKYMRPATKGKFRVKNEFWFAINGCPAWTICK